MKIHYQEIKNDILDVKLDKKKEVYNWGADNKHPQLLDYLSGASVTTKSCIDKVAKAIYGKSFGEVGKLKVNSKQTMNELLRTASREYAKYNNLYLHITYMVSLETNSTELVIKSISVLTAQDIRSGRKDSTGYNGKYIKADWASNPKEKDFIVYDAYTSNQSAIKAQIDKAGGILKWKGQILHLQKDTSKVYSASDMDCVLPEIVAEINASKFKSNNTLTGFIGTKLMTVQKFDTPEDKNNFNKKLQSVQGVENQNSIVLLESTSLATDLDNQVRVDDLSTEINDKMFEYSETSSERAICKAHAVPLILINPSDNSMFGDSASLLKEARKTLYEDKEEERDMIEETLRMLLKNFNVKQTKELKIINPFDENKEESWNY